MALIGYVDRASRSVVEGWACDPDHPDDPVTLSISVNGSLRGGCQAVRPHPGALAPSGERTPGKCGFRFVFHPPLPPFSEQRITVAETWSEAIIPNGCWTLPRPDLPEQRQGLDPILVTSTGRCGTTMLMNEFARHPELVVAESYPYEIKQIAYFSAALRALAADAEWEGPDDPDRFTEMFSVMGMGRLIGRNPHNRAGFFDVAKPTARLREFFHRTIPSRYATMFRDIILEFYTVIAESRRKQNARYFCEKADVDEETGLGARLFFHSTKEMIMVRDPRDLLCSSAAFWKLSQDEALARLKLRIPRLFRLAREAAADTIVVRYEDLLREPTMTRQSISRFLDVDLMQDAAAEYDGIPGAHRTSNDFASSIGRWRQDLTDAQIDACETLFRPFMDYFGYDAGPRSTARPSHDSAGCGIVAAEGGAQVLAMMEDPALDRDEAQKPVPMLDVTFGKAADGTSMLLEGWSLPEPNWAWSSSYESHLRLPAIRTAGDYRVYLVGVPYTAGTVLPSQRITVLVDGYDAGTATVTEKCVLSIAVPQASIGTGRPVGLTLLLPDAARPSDVLGEKDARLLGFSMYRMAICRIETNQPAAPEDWRRPFHGQSATTADDPADNGLVAGRFARTLRDVSALPDLEYRDRARLYSLPMFNSGTFIRLILALETEFGVELHEDEVDSIATMGDAVRILQDKVSGP